MPQYVNQPYSPAGSAGGQVPAYANPPAFQYAQIDPNIRYGAKNAPRPFSYAGPSTGPPPQAPQPPDPRTRPHASSLSTPTIAHPGAAGSYDPRYTETAPGGGGGGGRTHGHNRHHSHSTSLPSINTNNLSVAQPDPTLRPASPLQEPYQGTYQSISPMPSPIIIPAKGDEDDVSDAEPLEAGQKSSSERSSHRRKKSSKDERERGKRDSSRVRHERPGSSHGPNEPDVVLIEPGVTQQRRVSFYNPTADALALQEALSHVRHIDHKTLIRILPRLSTDDILDLRKEYKRHVKIHGKGINIAKHINLKLGNNAFGKACYATALGRWESEAYWANCYYQTGNSRRELLIESLMGRRNSEIHAIKECFRDPRYLDSLERCMRAELKADKFRTAVLLALEEKRQSEREPADEALIERDVYDLHRAVVARDGGETAMIAIIVRRSDSHLREVLRVYEKTYRHNFAKAMIAKSPNLVVRSAP